MESKVLCLTGTIDPHRAGFNSPAFIFVSVKPGSLERVAQHLAAIPEVSYLVAIIGEADLLVEIICVNSDHLMNVIIENIHTIEDITHTRTSTILQVYKEMLPSLSLLNIED